jgi:hypothetical protein
MSAHRQHHAGWNGRRPVVATRIRFVMTFLAAAVAIVCFVQGKALIALGCMNRMAGDILIWVGAVPATVLAMLCCLIGFGLHRGSVGWMRAALAFDAVLATGALAVLIVSGLVVVRTGDYDGLSTLLLFHGGVACAALLCAAEAASLMQACRGSRSGWWIFACFAAAIVALAVVLPVVTERMQRRHILPLQTYVVQHWFAVPDSATVRVTHSPDRNGVHLDVLWLREGDRLWLVSATHEQGVGWRCAASNEVAWTIGPSVEAGPLHVAERELRAAGVARAWYDANALTTDQNGEVLHRFPARPAGGTYTVNGRGRIGLALAAPLVVSE